VRILSRYLAREFLASSGAVLAGLVVTWLAGDSLRRLDELGESTSEGLARIALASMDVLPFGIPLACIGGAIWTLSRAMRHREITAIRAGGIPLRRALVPVLASATLVALLLGLLTDRVVVPSRAALSDAPDQSRAEREARPRWLLGRYWWVRGRSMFSAGHFDPGQSTARDVSVLRLDESNRVAERIEAESAVNIDGALWEFRQVRIHSFPANAEVEYRESVVMRVDLGLSSGDLARAQRPPDQLSLHKLVRAIRELGEQGPEAPELARLRTALHGRLLEPIAVVILVLFAIPLGIGDVERGDSLPRALLLSLLWAMGFWLCWTLAVLLGQSGTVPAFAPVWLVTVAALVLGLWRYARIKE
jgi:lipopolysaccharide export system permease protein